MKFYFLGTGSAFTLKNYQTNVLIEENGKFLLIDAGNDIRFSLNNMGFSYKDIDALFISHLHSDHIGGCEYLAFTTYFDPTCKEKIQLFANNKLIKLAWMNTLKGGLESVQGKVLTLDSYFDVNMIRDNGKFIWQDIKFEIVQSVHIMNGYSIVPTYGLMITDPTSKKIFYTGDCQFNPNQIKDFYNQADFIFQDCETASYQSGVHAHFSELSTLSPDIKKKMALIHYQDNVLDESGRVSDQWKKKVDDEGFNSIGFIEKGQIIDSMFNVYFEVR